MLDIINLMKLISNGIPDNAIPSLIHYYNDLSTYLQVLRAYCTYKHMFADYFKFWINKRLCKTATFFTIKMSLYLLETFDCFFQKVH